MHPTILVEVQQNKNKQQFNGQTFLGTQYNSTDTLKRSRCNARRWMDDPDDRHSHRIRQKRKGGGRNIKVLFCYTEHSKEADDMINQHYRSDIKGQD
eukprot:9409145-Heterocapsa_arctica.AAC.1